MTQIKLFMERTPNFEEFEKKVNDFLQENEGRIEVRDIKYTAEHPNPTKVNSWMIWTAVVIYETIK